MLCRLFVQQIGSEKNRQCPKPGPPKEDFPFLKDLSQILIWASDLKIEESKPDH